MGFSGNDFIPMSANFQLDLYMLEWKFICRVECDGEYYVHFLANEVPIKLDMPPLNDTT